jgi:hypothetical protein
MPAAPAVDHGVVADGGGVSGRVACDDPMINRDRASGVAAGEHDRGEHQDGGDLGGKHHEAHPTGRAAAG